MEFARQAEHALTPTVPGLPSNDNRRAPLTLGRSPFPPDAVARIDGPSRPVATAGRARAKGWRLALQRRRPPVVEPLMGWTADDDTASQVRLEFPTRDSAVRYAERQGLAYTVHAPDDRAGSGHSAEESAHAFSDATLQRLGLGALRESYGRALDAANRNDPPGPRSWASPMDVVRDGTLPLDAKRSILINWAWTEYLIDQATNEGMPENGRPSRLDEVEQALLALERAVAADPAAAGGRLAA